MGMSRTAAFLGSVAVAALAQQVSAAIIDVPFDNGDGTVAGTISLVEIVNGLPPGGQFYAPDVAPAPTDVTLVFQLTVSAGMVEQLGVSVVDPPFTRILATSAGWIPDNPDWEDITSITGPADSRIFKFDEGGNGVAAGETSDLFWVSYSSLDLDGSLNLNFMITDGVPSFTVSVPLVPAPGALALLGTGLFGLIGGRRRR